MISRKLRQEILNLPEMQAEKDIWQNNFHQYDVYNHSLKCAKYLQRVGADKNLIVAGYLHDIGKPPIRKPKIKNGKVQKNKEGKKYHKFDDHEKLGEKMVLKIEKNFFERNNLDQKRIATLVGLHYEPMKGIKKTRKTENYSEFVEAFDELEKSLEKKEVTKKEIMKIFLADTLAKGLGCTDIKELKLFRKIILSKKKNLRRIYKLQKKMYQNKKPYDGN